MTSTLLARRPRCSTPGAYEAAGCKGRNKGNQMLAACMLNWPQKFKLWKVHAILYARRQFYLQVLCKDELAYMDIRENLCFCIALLLSGKPVA